MSTKSTQAKQLKEIAAIQTTIAKELPSLIIEANSKLDAVASFIVEQWTLYPVNEPKEFRTLCAEVIKTEWDGDQSGLKASTSTLNRAFLSIRDDKGKEVFRLRAERQQPAVKDPKFNAEQITKACESLEYTADDVQWLLEALLSTVES